MDNSKQNDRSSQLQMNFIFESLYQNNQEIPDEVLENKNGRPVSVSVQAGQIKMMDTILFEQGFQPKKWIFTDLLGRIQHFLDIGALSDLKNKFPKGIDALQLYKIPTRDFLPYFYYHTLQFKQNGQMTHHMIVRVSHFIKDLGQTTQRNSEFYEEKIPDEEYEFFAFQISNRIGGQQKKNFVKKLHDDVNQSRIQVTQSNPEYTGFSEQYQNPNESIYALTTNEYVTQTELLKGLQQIGEKFGKDHSVEIQIKRPKTMQVLTQEKSRKMIRYQQQLQDQRNQLKEKGKRIVELFPKYLEKTGSKTHAQFLFGNVSSDRLFKDYQRLRFQKQHQQEVELLKQESQRNQNMQNHMSGSSFYRKTGNKSIFNVQMSAETQYLDNSAISEMPYQDAFNYDRQSTKLNNQTNITEINEQLILNQDISMFHQINQSGLGQTADHLSLKDSVLSLRDDNNQSTLEVGADGTEQSEFTRTQNDFLNKSGKQQRTIEEHRIQQSQNEMDKDLIALMLMNKDLDNLVVIDKKKTVDNIRQKIQFDESRMQQIASLIANESDAVFTNRRRRLDQDELDTYHQWKQLKQDQQNQIYLNMSNENQYPTDVKQVFPITKRSKTSSGVRKNGKLGKIKNTALSLLQIKGQEAKFQNVSRAEVLKQHIVSSKEQAQLLQKSYEEKKVYENNQKRKHLGSKKNSINQSSQINFPKEANKIAIKTQSLNLDDHQHYQASFMRIIQGIQRV
ncbi:UNKNOWN [Stylonychia lemnae]|uniref:Uncharacterized protein n=1 Tax=Stylonychia lemnae TaxID=5949 RepID=A0A078ANI1_STYLE|nr:UNKNOWN [Stylonychia lemnae]|eukprot:CDW83481.1 UNKNOWN [Stylonychia lemnae]